MGGIVDTTLDVLGLSPDLSGAIGQAQFNPYNIQSSAGSLNYDPNSRSFNSQLNPQLSNIQRGLFSQFGQANPEQQLSLFRQQAAPFNEAQSLGLENRLFSQGRLDHSQVDQPGGARRGLFDAQLNQDFGFQQQAQQQSQQQQMALIQQLLGINSLESGLFSQGQGFGQIQQQGNTTAAGLQAQQDSFGPNAFFGLLGAGLGGYAAGGFGA